MTAIKQRVVLRHNNSMVPFVAGQFAQFGVVINSFGDNADIRFPSANHLGNRRRAALLDG